MVKMLDPNIEADLEAKLIAVNKADMKLHLAKLDLRDAVCDAICSMLPKDSDRDDIVKAAKTLKVFNTFDVKEKKTIVDTVWNALN